MNRVDFEFAKKISSEFELFPIMTIASDGVELKLELDVGSICKGSKNIEISSNSLEKLVRKLGKTETTYQSLNSTFFNKLSIMVDLVNAQCWKK